MKQEGWLDHAWSKFVDEISDHGDECEESDEQNSNNREAGALGIEEMAGIFVLHAGLTCFSLAYALFKFCVLRKGKFRDIKYIMKHKNNGKLRQIMAQKAWKRNEKARRPQSNNHGSDRRKALEDWDVKESFKFHSGSPPEEDSEEASYGKPLSQWGDKRDGMQRNQMTRQSQINDAKEQRKALEDPVAKESFRFPPRSQIEEDFDESSHGKSVSHWDDEGKQVQTGEA